MSNPENYSSSEVELSLLRSDLSELFQQQSDIVALYQPDDWSKPIEIVLGGRCRFTNADDEDQEIYVHVRQRIDNYGTDYLIITHQDDKSYWRQVNDAGATQIFVGSEKQLNQASLEALRFYFGSDRTEWMAKYSKECSECEDLYDMAHNYAGRQLAE